MTLNGHFALKSVSSSATNGLASPAFEAPWHAFASHGLPATADVLVGIVFNTLHMVCRSISEQKNVPIIVHFVKDGSVDFSVYKNPYNKPIRNYLLPKSAVNVFFLLRKSMSAGRASPQTHWGELTALPWTLAG